MVKGSGTEPPSLTLADIEAGIVGDRAERWGRTYAEFYTLVGRCIGEWAFLEEWLFKCCHECLGPYEQSAIVYYKQPGIEQRLTLVDELVRSVLPKPAKKSGSHPHQFVKAWDEVSANIRSLQNVRRRLAHQPISEINNYLGYMAVVVGIGDPIFQVHASRHEQMREREAQKKPLLKVDLENHLTALAAVTLELEKFYEMLLARPPKSLLPSKGPSP